MIYESKFGTGHVNKGFCNKCGSNRLRVGGGEVICSNCDYVIYKKPRRNKYNARKKQSVDGRVRDSIFESSVADELYAKTQSGEIKGYDSQFKVVLNIYKADGSIAFTKNWKVDFRQHNLDGSFTLIEAKGLEGIDYKWKRDILLNVWLDEHPNHTYEVRKVNRSREELR